MLGRRNLTRESFISRSRCLGKLLFLRKRKNLVSTRRCNSTRVRASRRTCSVSATGGGKQQQVHADGPPLISISFKQINIIIFTIPSCFNSETQIKTLNFHIFQQFMPSCPCIGSLITSPKIRPSKPSKFKPTISSQNLTESKMYQENSSQK